MSIEAEPITISDRDIFAPLLELCKSRGILPTGKRCPQHGCRIMGRFEGPNQERCVELYECNQCFAARSDREWHEAIRAGREEQELKSKPMPEEEFIRELVALFDFCGRNAKDEDIAKWWGIFKKAPGDRVRRGFRLVRNPNAKDEFLSPRTIGRLAGLHYLDYGEHGDVNAPRIGGERAPKATLAATFDMKRAAAGEKPEA